VGGGSRRRSPQATDDEYGSLMPVRIVTDSSCDLTAEEVAKHGVAVVPLSIRFGDTEYEDRSELSVEDFYAKLASSEVLPETAAPAPGKFEAAFRRQQQAGADAVVCINLSAELSATMQSAQNAARALAGELDVRVVDSHSITSGLGTQVMLAAEAAASGASADDVVALVQDLASRTHVFGALDTLDNLKKGGRIGGAQALLGSLLSIKPIVDISTGKVEEAGKARTRKKALEVLRDKVAAAGAIEHVSVHHGFAPEVDEMLDLLHPIVPREQIRVGVIGPVIGTHGGPRVMGVTWLASR
jgi:DegV family protein with EDD domain